MTVHSSGDSVDSVLSQLRAEEPLEQDASQAALLRHECGVLQELEGDEDAAAREYLAAFNSDPDFKEPLEALIRLYGRKRDEKNLGKLLEALVDAAHSPLDAARAAYELAIYRTSVLHDVAAAKTCLEQAVDSNPNDAAAWLELELAAASDGDQETRMRAREARAGLTMDPTWQGHLLIELAEQCAESGDLERAGEILDTVVALDGKARFRSRLSLENIGLRAGDTDLQAHALEGQAELVTQALEDPELATRFGIPSIMVTQAQAADAWLRAGELRRRSDDPAGAVAALSAAAARLDDDALIARLSMMAAEAAGDSEAAVRIAREQLEAGVSGPAGAALWMRVGQVAEMNEDFVGALVAYGKALDLDPKSTPALALRTDLLAQGEDAEALAEALEAEAAAAGSDAARAQAWMTVAYVWSVRVGDIDKGKRALEKSKSLGASPAKVARVARSFAALCGNETWYDESTQALIELATDVGELAMLWFELGRSRLVRGEDDHAVEAFTKLAAIGGDEASGPSWLGRTLGAYGVGIGNGGPRDPEVVANLAEVESDEGTARGLTIVAAMLAAKTGKSDEALKLLVDLHEGEPADLVVALFLANLRRLRGDATGAAAVLATSASMVTDPALAGALQIEAGLLLWSADRNAAVAAFEVAMDYAPNAAQIALAWSLRAANPDDLQARARALDLAEETDGDPSSGALERFGLAVVDREANGRAQAAIEELEALNAGGDVALAAALARLVWPTDEQGALAALELIDVLGGAATTVARAERFRISRFVERDMAQTLQAAREWAEVEPSLAPAIEWLAAAYAADDRDQEIDARIAIAERMSGEQAVSVGASAAAVRMLHRPGRSQPMLDSTSTSARLMNLELALPGAEPDKRARALRALGDSLGADAQRDAERMAAWSDLAAGEAAEAQLAFRSLVEADADDIASLEGLRAASEAIGDHTTAGVALARLGNNCKNDERAAVLWEQAGLTLLEHTDAHDDAEIAFRRALERDETRAVAFDKLFRRVRKRKENDALLKLIEMRLKVTDNEPEITKMYWERARVYRDKGDNDRALEALKDVTMLEPDHVGALALAGEISIKKGDFAGAAPLLARLARQPEAPKKQRLVSGIAAVDLYEKRLSQPEESLKVLSQLYRDGLSTLKVRERLARTAARVGNWEEAVAILERLMEERDKPKGRAEAARLAMCIYRDKLKAPKRAAKAVARLLGEVPDDREAIELLLNADVSDQLRSVSVPTAKKLILQKLSSNPFDLPKVELIAKIANEGGDVPLRRTALGCAVALGNESTETKRAIAEIDARMEHAPQIVLDTDAILAIADPDDVGPIPELFALAAPVITEAMGPSLKSEDVGRRQRVDSGHPMRNAVSRWMGALGFNDFDLYIGGRQPKAVKGVAGDQPALVVGTEISQPLDAAGRSAMAREVFALRRGTTSVTYCDDNTIASIVVALCKDAGVDVADPPYAIYREVERVIKKAMSRRIRKTIVDVAQRVVSSRQDAIQWAAAARRSIDRMALIASGDASSVIDQIVGEPGTPARLAMDQDVRAKRLLSFALSAEYLDLRKKLGMGIV